MSIRLVILLLIIGACNTSTYTQPLSVDGYNDRDIKKIHLEHKLDEISGIVFDKITGTFLCINDEEGKLYRIDTANYKIVETIRFAKGGDYEGITLNGKSCFVMNSRGDIWHVLLNGNKSPKVDKYDFPVPQFDIEFETVYYNEKDKLLYLVSKQSPLDKDKESTHVFAFDTQKMKFLQKPIHWFGWDDVDKKLNDKKIKSLHVSDATIHPLSKNIYLVASIEKLLIVLDEHWKVVAVYELDKKMFKQPEGIAFDALGNMYITNEAQDGRPNIIRIPIK